MQGLTLQLGTLGGANRVEAQPNQLVIAGWTGRDAKAMEHHIAELEALGVARPASTPMYYQVAAARLTTSHCIDVCGQDSSGEVEFVLLQWGGRLWLGVGSDHTDRKLETVGVAVSKQLCEKPVCPEFWLHEDVAPHWGRLVLRSFVVENGQRLLYQEGPVTTMLDPQQLIAGTGGATLADGTAMFCGTLAAKGGVRPAARFEFELHDPILNRTLSHGYDIRAMPIAG